MKWVFIFLIVLICSGFTLNSFDFSILSNYTKQFEGTDFSSCKINSRNFGKNKTYEEYTLIDNVSSSQYRYIKSHMTVDPKSGFLFDEDGFIGVALGYNFGNIGARYYITLDTGIIIPVIKIDAKARIDASDGCQGNYADDVIEFVIDTDKAMKYFGSSNGYASNGNFNNYKYLKGSIVKIESVPAYGVTSKYNGFITTNGNIYYYQNGKMLTGQQKINGKWYYFLGNGVMYNKGWGTVKGNKAYFYSDGHMATGLTKINNKLYYFLGSGAMYNKGWGTVKGNKAYFYSDGHMAVGFTRVDNNVYYFDSKGFMKTGWQSIDGKKYYFSSKGQMATADFVQIDDSIYYFDELGVMQTGKKTISGKMYYFLGSGAMYNRGWGTVKGNRCYFYRDGHMATGLTKIDDKIYYFLGSGAMYNRGWGTVKGNRCYFYPDGHMAVNEVVDGFYLNENGIISDNPDEELETATVNKDDIGTIKIITAALRIRSGPGTEYEQVSLAYMGDMFKVYEKTNNNGYNWYRIGNGQWVADKNGEYVLFTK